MPARTMSQVEEVQADGRLRPSFNLLRPTRSLFRCSATGSTASAGGYATFIGLFHRGEIPLPKDLDDVIEDPSLDSRETLLQKCLDLVRDLPIEP